ncbi:pectin lyase fold/virulence factor [Truncatella angustata]|uniref:pectin lyase n=1 Tax=Truncatella angustata TaxID=152316 RepID=A0A9P8RL51_9PEZI|nr:pectin lyase fold/virulence factor [Truncatella angustata]KAH6647894.1 pectin lyase fold/virulence factor [Truncatella angustata]
MISFRVIAALAGLARFVNAQSVSGAAEGFAQGVTGGGDATPVYPADIDELIELLGSDEPQVIILSKTYDFLESEGTKTETGCAPYGTAAGCQLAIDGTGTWCGSNTAATVSYDVAATEGIEVKSNKTLIGEGSAGILKGKGLRMTNGVSNIIVQNIHITDLNPQYVWGGDAFTFAETDLIWIDHCTTSLLGRQHYVFGQKPSSRITLSNNFINGSTSWSAGCDGYHYWTIELVGTEDQITFQNNYVYHTSGRSPALSGSTLFHAVNSVWSDNNGHAIEGDTNGQGLFEGCVFENVTTVVVDDFKGSLFSSSDSTTNAKCESALGRACVENVFSNSGAFDKSDTGFFSNFTGLSIASATAASSAEKSVPSAAGFGKLTTSSTESTTDESSSSAVSKVSSAVSKSTAVPSKSTIIASKSTSTLSQSTGVSKSTAGSSKSTVIASKSTSTVSKSTGVSKCKKRRAVQA